MDNKNIQSILQDALEKEIPSSEVNLWQAVKASLVAGKTLQQGENMNTTKPRRMARVAFITLMIVILLALVFITPQGRAFAQSILQFFVRSEGDAIPVPTSERVTWVDVTPGIPSATTTPLPAFAIFADECGDFGSPTCTIEQIRDKVDFTIKEPGNIPEEIYFVGATGGPDSIFLSYITQDQSNGLVIFVERWTGSPSPETDLVGASAVIEKVMIGALTGEYFKGSFVYEDGESVATWDPNFGTETLRWVDDDVSYRMQYFSFQTLFGKEGMVALAESMTTDPVTKEPTPVPTEDPYLWDPNDTYNLSVSAAEQQAGFKLLLPTQLPETLSLVGASYDSEHNIVAVFYLLDQNLYGPSANGFTLRQQIASNPTDCFLCEVLIGDYNEFVGSADAFKEIVPSDDKIETVQVGAVTGKYIQGVWSGTDCCGWVWDPTPYRKVLRWWSNGTAFELSYYDDNFEKADMIKIAESIK